MQVFLIVATIVGSGAVSRNVAKMRSLATCELKRVYVPATLGPEE